MIRSKLSCFNDLAALLCSSLVNLRNFWYGSTITWSLRMYWIITVPLCSHGPRHCPRRYTGYGNYFQSIGNIPTRTSQFLQEPRCQSVVPLAQWKGLVLRVSKYSWICLLVFYLLFLQHNTTTQLESLTLLGIVISRSSQY